jgi:hypothetical protein
MAIGDTSPAARDIQLRIHRSMSGEQRILMALEMSLLARDFARERIRSEHPEWDLWQVQRELLRIAFLPQPLPLGLR